MVFQKRKKRHGGNWRDTSWQIAKKEDSENMKMMCLYKNCTNSSEQLKKKGSLRNSVTFFPFPNPTTELAKYHKWLIHSDIDEPALTKNSGSSICSEHFSHGRPTKENPNPVAHDDTVINNVPKRKKGRPSTKNIPVVVEDTGPDPNIKGTIAKSGQVVETLQLLCWSEDLSPAQLEVQEKRDKEYKEVVTKLESLAKENNGQHIQKGDSSVQAFQYNTTTPPNYTPQPPPNGTDFSNNPPPLVPTQSTNMMIQTTKGPQGQTGYKLVLDPRLGMVIGTMTPTGQLTTNANTPISAATPIMTTSPSVTQQVRPIMRKRGRPSINIQPPAFPLPQLPAIAPSTTATSGLRPGENTAIGGISAGSTIPKVTTTSAVVDLTTTADDGKPAADSREVAFNKLQGKTFPSLVVVARPHLHAKEAAIANDRTVLDAKVKAVLVHPPTKFTEWLIQQGLVRSEQYCTLHPLNKLNLGMYSDVSKFPYSGGYVWISECCPNRFVSVFSGSLFEGATHTPTVLLKLIYHWACQTNIQNVVQWVKVDNLYVKGIFTWFRAACTYALQKHLKPLGGPGKRIEVGVISLGTTSQDGSQRQVKVEVLGILDPEKRLIRLRAVEPLADGERNYKRRFSKILEPLRSWVQTDSIIATDLTVDKGTLQIMGFTNIIQSTSSGVPGNQGVMEYLRKIVPRMFQNTLSLLSRQIIQQFLDELVWREWYGQTAAQAFNNLVLHLQEQTRMPSADTLITRLNKVAANPFKYHVMIQPNLPPPSPAASDSNTVVKRYGRKRAAPSGVTYNLDLDKPAPKKQNITDIIPHAQSQTSNESVPLETYYYGTLGGEPFSPLAQKVVLNVRCCVCKVPYGNNIQLLDHLLKHAHNISSKVAVKQCRYCLASLPTVEELNTHIAEVHPIETKSYDVLHPACLICEQRFSSSYVLGKHMSREHVPQELPYPCGTCGFRTSSHRLAIDHFYEQHNGATAVQCPFCLKSFAVWSSGRIMSINVTFFLAHLQKHQKKNLAKKCNKCALWFIQKESLKDHMLKAHMPMLGKKGVRSWPLPANYFMVPKSKQYGVVFEGGSQPSQIQYNQPASPPEEPFHKLHLVVPKNTDCKECNRPITSSEHFPQKLSCSSCRFISDCINTMQMHKIKCRKTPAVPIPHFPLSSYLHCICGYSNNCGNQIAKHLALCERKTAYPTPETAKEAVDNNTHSMLDVLGLVRRNDDAREEIEISSDEEEISTTTKETTDLTTEKDPTDLTTTDDVVLVEKEATVLEDTEATKEIKEEDVTISVPKEAESSTQSEIISITSIEEEKDASTADECEIPTEDASATAEDPEEASAAAEDPEEASAAAEDPEEVAETPTKSPSPVKELEDELAVKDVESSDKVEETVPEKEVDEAMEVDEVASLAEEAAAAEIPEKEDTEDASATKEVEEVKSTPEAEESTTAIPSIEPVAEATISDSSEPEKSEEPEKLDEPENPSEEVEPMECSPTTVEPMECSPPTVESSETNDTIPVVEIETMKE